MGACENRQTNGQAASGITVQGFEEEQKVERALSERYEHTPHQSMQIECLDVMNGTMNDCAQEMELEVKLLSPLQTMLKAAESLTTLDLCSVLAFDNGISCDELVKLMTCCVGLCGQTTVLGMTGWKCCVRR